MTFFCVRCVLSATCGANRSEELVEFRLAFAKTVDIRSIVDNCLSVFVKAAQNNSALFHAKFAFHGACRLHTLDTFTLPEDFNF